MWGGGTNERGGLSEDSGDWPFSSFLAIKFLMRPLYGRQRNYREKMKTKQRKKGKLECNNLIFKQERIILRKFQDANFFSDDGSFLDELINSRGFIGYNI